jgi:glyoxylase-like metal-dependent hydrolase (beta-lactamase superfamily II)
MAFDAERDATWRKAMIEVYGFRESPVHREMRDGEVLEAGGTRMRFVHLPGHTPGHSGIWFEEEDLLFVADIDLTSFGPFYGEPLADARSTGCATWARACSSRRTAGGSSSGTTCARRWIATPRRSGSATTGS